MSICDKLKKNMDLDLTLTAKLCIKCKSARLIIANRYISKIINVMAIIELHHEIILFARIFITRCTYRLYWHSFLN